MKNYEKHPETRSIVTLQRKRARTVIGFGGCSEIGNNSSDDITKTNTEGLEIIEDQSYDFKMHTDSQIGHLCASEQEILIH